MKPLNLFRIAMVVGLFLAACPNHAQIIYEPYTVKTIAGQAGVKGSDDGANAHARFWVPSMVVADAAGNLYVSDAVNHTIRQLTPAGSDWIVTTIAGQAGVPGSADGTGTDAQFYFPATISIDSTGNLYVTEQGNNIIRRMVKIGDDWEVTTIAGQVGIPGSADGTNDEAQFNFLTGLKVDPSGTIYVSEGYDHTIRKIVPVDGNWVVTTIAGQVGIAGSDDGTNSAALFNQPADIALDGAGNLYVADYSNYTIRRLAPSGANWVVTTIAGSAGEAGIADGISSAARFMSFNSIVSDTAGNLYVGDTNSVRKLTPNGTNWFVTTLAGKPGVKGSSNGTGSAARFNIPYAGVDADGNLLLTDLFNFTIRKGYPALSIASFSSGFGWKAGRFSFELRGQAGLSSIVEVSTDLVSWLPVWTNTLAGPLKAPHTFIDPDSASAKAGFYRLRTQ